MIFHRLRFGCLSLGCLSLLAGWWISAAPVEAASASITQASDLMQDAAQSQAIRRPVVLFFTQPGCSYCRIVRHDYFLPMLREHTERSERDPVLLREISITGQRSVKGLDGHTTSEAALAARYKVQMTPTVMFIGPDGESLAEPIIGGNHPDYLRLFERRHEEAAAKIGGKRVHIRH